VTLCLMTEVAEQEVPGATVVALSGGRASLWKLSAGQPTAVVVASNQSRRPLLHSGRFSSGYFRRLYAYRRDPE